MRCGRLNSSAGGSSAFAAGSIAGAACCAHNRVVKAADRSRSGRHSGIRAGSRKKSAPYWIHARTGSDRVTP